MRGTLMHRKLLCLPLTFGAACERMLRCVGVCVRLFARACTFITHLSLRCRFEHWRCGGSGDCCGCRGRSLQRRRFLLKKSFTLFGNVAFLLKSTSSLKPPEFLVNHVVPKKQQTSPDKPTRFINSLILILRNFRFVIKIAEPR